MTADAKVGLLLGLILIVMIAFIINGLPNIVRSESYGDVPTTSIVDEKHRSLIIGRNTTDIARTIDTILPPEQLAMQSVSDSETGGVRYISEFSGDVDVLSNNATTISLLKSDSREYMVKPGDNLAVIAIKVYGREYGNKNAIVQQIFQANRNCLNSPDQIQVGQKLLMPALKPVGKRKVSLKTNILKKAKSLFQGTSNKSKQGIYIVKQNDSLWRIAENVLGDGSRYHEIQNLNKNIIPDGDDIGIGMSLKLPSH